MKCVHGRDVRGFYGGECWECEQEKRRHQEIVGAIELLRPREEKVEATSSSAPADIEYLGRSVTNPGDFECPECRYISLKRDARRCPFCRSEIDSSYWVNQREVEAFARRAAAEEERRRTQAAAEQLARERVEEAKRNSLEAWRWVLAAIFALLAFAAAGYLTQ